MHQEGEAPVGTCFRDSASLRQGHSANSRQRSVRRTEAAFPYLHPSTLPSREVFDRWEACPSPYQDHRPQSRRHNRHTHPSCQDKSAFPSRTARTTDLGHQCIRSTHAIVPIAVALNEQSSRTFTLRRLCGAG